MRCESFFWLKFWEPLRLSFSNFQKLWESLSKKSQTFWEAPQRLILILATFLLQACLVRCLPNFSECHGWVEAMEYAERQSNALDQCPGDESVEVLLNLKKKISVNEISKSIKKVSTYWIGDHFLSFKCVNGNHCNVADQQESDNLATRLWAVVFWQMHSATCHVGNEEKLQNDLQNSNRRCDRDEKILVVFVCI